jgi:hypothetical protein
MTKCKRHGLLNNSGAAARDSFPEDSAGLSPLCRCCDRLRVAAIKPRLVH